MHKAFLLDVAAQFHASCFSLLALVSSPHHLQHFLLGLRALAGTAMSGVKVKQQLVPKPACRMETLPFLARDECAVRSGTLLQSTLPCSLVSCAPGKGW